MDAMLPTLELRSWQLQQASAEKNSSKTHKQKRFPGISSLIGKFEPTKMILVPACRAFAGAYRLRNADEAQSRRTGYTLR
ncbi:unnamed protein product [Fusarium graminearum]|uniref:Chromosome 4, complete genome n=1 Tax=Gibberella zeae (strain ATCC MYA-4620 / CBS 123657 / FGSC 9075 / NRRL 31084 / PH-1) TaxID=229533 RepID=A0A098DU91_GIBZE|nr:unnamed protein product [Fusarium graminearum]CZS72878.1 unnamed protein product [Fusarium graminearum]